MIKLRKIEPTDLPFLYQWENDASAWSDGSNHNPLSQQDLRDYIASTSGDIYRDGQLRLIIESVDSLTLGCIDLFDFDPRNRRAAIGMYIAPECRGRGVGREAVRLLEEYAFGHLNLRLIYAVIATSNHACSTIFRDAGFTATQAIPEWTLKDSAQIWYKNNPDT
jgi:diamine N-acetyltransferase